MTGLEVAVGWLIAWAVRKAGRVGKRVDAEVDQAIDAGLDRLHDLVAAKLGDDPALEKLREEAAQTGEVGTRTQARVRLALEDAVEQDPVFTAAVEKAVAELEASGGSHNVVVHGDVRADRGGISIGGVTGGQVNFADPPRPDRSEG
ncbi:chromosome partitioning protein [Amycolatopsis sp. CA-128772]|uniref:chromosome partitioning protein n=1 Tax=Amycolatopsis sp. CA-128772 TaxID=2073159 RepID=UPI000CD0CC9B|nr:chromosome partitioning protein [Amycolatopsis sp. CA-128772]